MKLVYHIRRRNARESARKIGKNRMNGGMVVRTREKIRQCDPEKGRTRWPHGAVLIKSHTEQSYRESLTMLSKPGVIPGCRTVRSKPRCRNGLSVRRSQTNAVQTEMAKQRCPYKEVCTKKSISQKGICRLTVRFRSAHPGISAPVPRGCGSRRCRCSCPCSRCFWRRDRDCRARSCRCSQSPWSDCRG